MRLYHLGRATVIGLGARSVPIMSSLLVSWALANFAGLSILGQYAFAVVTMQVACGNVTLGVDGTLLRLLIRRPMTRARTRDDRLLGLSYATTATIAVVFTGIAFLAGLALLATGSELLGLLFLQLTPMPLGFCVVRISVAALRAKGKISLAQWVDGVVPAALTATACLVAVIARRDWLIYIPLATSVGWMINALIARALVARYYGKLARDSNPLRSRARLIKSSMPQQAVNAVNYMSDWLPLVLIALMLSAENLGIFRIVTQLALPLQMMNQTVEFSASTAIARAYRGGDIALSLKVLRDSRLVMVAATLPMAIVLAAASPWILQIGFSVSGTIPIVCLGIILLGHVANASAGPVASTLATTGSSRLMLVPSSVALLSSLVLGSVLGAFLGLIGICAGIVLGWIARAAINRYYVVNTLMSGGWAGPGDQLGAPESRMAKQTVRGHAGDRASRAPGH